MTLYYDDNFNIIAQSKINHMLTCYAFKGMHFGSMQFIGPFIFLNYKHYAFWEAPKKREILFAVIIYAISSVQSLSRVQLFATPWIAACQASLSITHYRSWFKLMPFESVMPSSHLILCRPLLLLPPIPPSIRVFSNESALCMR